MALDPRQPDRTARSEAPDTIRPRTLGILIAIGVVSLGASVVIGVLGEAIEPSIDADTGSYASIGHRALVELLEDLGIPVLVSRFESVTRSRERALLVLAEPEEETPDETRLETILEESSPTLVVLPEWEPSPHRSNERWTGPLIRSDSRLSTVLAALDVELVTVYTSAEATWTYHDVDRVSIALDSRVRPALDPDLQLLRPNPKLEPIIESEEGILLARIASATPNRETYVLSDPTPFSNRGLSLPGQAALAVGILDALRPKDGTVVFDETLHGVLVIPSAYASLFRYPLVLALVQTLVTAGAAIAMAARRFGSPLAPDPPIAKTPGYAIRNTAEWLHVAGHSAPLLDRYLETILRRVAAALSYRGPKDREPLAEFLDRTAARRKLAPRVADLDDAVAHAKRAGRDHHARILAATHDIHRYKETMLDGARRGTPRR